MYLYLYDLKGINKNSSKINKIEKNLTEYNLEGRKIYLDKISNLIKLFDNEIKKGVHTLVVVGTDRTVSIAINCLAKTKIPNNFTVSVIPLFKKKNKIANSLGINNHFSACESLLKRRVKKICLVGVNDSFFISQITLTNFRGKIETELGYSIDIGKKSDIDIVNFPLFTKIDHNCDPEDKKLEVTIQNNSILKNKNKKSFFRFSKLKINSKPVYNAIGDNHLDIKTPFNVSLSDKRVNFVVGRDRYFQ